MKTDAVFGETDTGLEASDFNIVVKTKAGVAVDTTGWSMVEGQRGAYEVTIPLMTVPGTIYMSKISDPTVFYDGFVDYDTSSMIEDDAGVPRFTANALEQGPNGVISNLTQSIFDYITGKVAKGTVIAPLAEAVVGKQLNIYQATSYETPAEIQINIGADFAPWLDGSYTPWFAVSKFSSQVTPDILAECTIANQSQGLLKVALTVNQTDIPTGVYRWQVFLRTPDNVKAHVTTEGKLEIKPLLDRV